jgi:hypothetical protein
MDSHEAPKTKTLAQVDTTEPAKAKPDDTAMKEKVAETNDAPVDTKVNETNDALVDTEEDEDQPKTKRAKTGITEDKKKTNDLEKEDEETESEDNDNNTITKTKAKSKVRKQPAKGDLPAKKASKGTLPATRDHSSINRYQPLPFWTPKRKPIKSKKRIYVFPTGLTERIREVAIDEVNNETTNFMNVASKAKSNELGDTPLEFLADPTMHEKKWPSNKDYGVEQTNRTKALEASKKLLNLPSSERAFAALDAKTHGDTAKYDLDKWYRKGLESAELEADLMMHTSVSKIAWIPDTIRVPKNGPLMGHYQLLVERADKSKERVTPSNDWVVKNFKPSVLANVQRIAYEVKEVLPGHGKNDTPTKFQGYINVEKTGVCVSQKDTRVINRLKYIKQRRIAEGPKYETDKKGVRKKVVDRKKKIIAAKWKGYSNKTKEYIDVTEAWVAQNFEEGFLQQVVSCTGTSTPFVMVPPGDSRSQTTGEKTNGPPIKYGQKEGERTCMCLGMANALFFLGHKQIGNTIYRDAHKYSARANAFRKFCLHLRQTYKLMNQVTFPVAATVNVLGDIFCLHLVTLRGDDGKEDHCVAITSEWIFDSNFSTALPRSRMSFDRCCSSDDVVSKFDGVVQVAVFPKITFK